MTIFYVFILQVRQHLVSMCANMYSVNFNSVHKHADEMNMLVVRPTQGKFWVKYKHSFAELTSIGNNVTTVALYHALVRIMRETEDIYLPILSRF